MGIIMQEQVIKFLIQKPINVLLQFYLIRNLLPIIFSCNCTIHKVRQMNLIRDIRFSGNYV